MKRKQKFLSTAFILILSLVCVLAPTPANAMPKSKVNVSVNKKKASAKPTKEKVKASAKLLPDDTILLKITNNNSQTISLSVKMIYKNGTTVMGESNEDRMGGIPGNTTVYRSETYHIYGVDDEQPPTSIDVEYSLANYKYYEPLIKNIDKVVSGEMTSVEAGYSGGDIFDQNVNVEIKNISKKDVYGDVVILCYSGDKLVASAQRRCFVISGGSLYENVGFQLTKKEYLNLNINSIKVVQSSLKYDNYEKFLKKHGIKIY